MKEDGIKNDSEKPRWDLIPWRELSDVVDVITFGLDKYSEDNWKYVEPKSRYFAACHRHLYAWSQGEKIDRESDKNHLAHAICCLLFLLWDDNEKVKKEKTTSKI